MTKLKDIIDNKNFCPAPWFHIVVTPRATIRPCNDFNGLVGTISETISFSDVYNNKTMQELRSSILDNEIHPRCFGCREKEVRIGNCKRNALIEGIKKWDLEETTLDIESHTNKIVWIDVRPTSACNLKCRHCYPVLSSSWKKDAILLKDMEIGRLYTNHIPEYTLMDQTELKKEIIKELASNIGKVRRIEFKGGEPLLRQDLIEYFLSNTISNINQAQIDISSNGTIQIKDSLSNILNQCQCLKMDYSVEGGEEMLKYIRDISLKDIEGIIKDTHDKIRPIKVGFKITQMVYNIFEFPNVYRWIKGLNLKKQTDISINNYVVKPLFLNLLSLPLEIRLKARDMLVAFIKTNPDCHETVKILCETLAEEQKTENVKLLKVYTKNVDQIRGVSLLNVEPRIGEFIYDK
jgi:MoaA/NifB/PqqE/SkfB family radical SAM enzyme